MKMKIFFLTLSIIANLCYSSQVLSSLPFEHHNAYPSHVSDANGDCAKGQCLASTQDLPAGIIIEKFTGIPVEASQYRAGMNFPIENRHVKWIGRDENGFDKWILVKSNAAYINHSCDPNCIVNSKGEVITIKPVKKGEELTISYNSRSLNNFPLEMQWESNWSFACLCELHNCQKFIDKFID